MTDDCATSHSKPSAVEPQLDTEVSDSSDATTAGSDDEVEPDLVDAPLLRSTDGGIRDESTRQCPASAVKRTRLGLTDPRSSHIDEGQQDTSDVYRNSTEEVVDEMTLRGRSVRKRPVVLYHRLAADINGGGPRRVLDTSVPLTTGGRQSSITASTAGLPCASSGRYALMSPFYPIGVRSHEQPAGPQIRRNGALDTPLPDATNQTRHRWILLSSLSVL